MAGVRSCLDEGYEVVGYQVRKLLTLTDRFLPAPRSPRRGSTASGSLRWQSRAMPQPQRDSRTTCRVRLGKTPGQPGEWTTGALKAGAMGFGGGLLGAGVGAAVGPMLGAGAGATGGGAGGAVGGAEGRWRHRRHDLAEGASGLGDALSLVGQGTGTIAAEAGAATPSTVAGVIPNQSGQFLSAGTQAPQGMVQEALKNVAQNTVSGSITGELKDPRTSVAVH